MEVPSTIGWQTITCNPLSPDELEPVWQEFPNASQLKYQTNLRDLFGNLKILDLLAIKLSIGDTVPVTQWVGESSVAIWFWDSQIARGHEGAVQVRFVKLLAERQAETLKQGVPIDQFEVAQLSQITGLSTKQICRQTSDNSIIFTHDLYGDWSRFQLLISHADDLVTYLRERLNSPMWYRPLRLYGLYLLEHRGDIAAWNELLNTFADEGNLLAQDILLEAPVFAANPQPLLELIRPNLISSEGQLLQRLLTRFLVSATLLNQEILELICNKGLDAIISANFRYPNWPLWPAMLHFLHKYREELIAKAPVEIGRIVQLCLDYAPQGVILRREAAQLGLMLGEKTLLARRDYRSPIYKNRKLFYRVALVGARELPDEISAFALKASERTEQISNQEDEQPNPIFVQRAIPFEPHFDTNEPLPEPWADGPQRNVNDDFREVVLEGRTLLPLIQVNPGVAREVTLAILIRCRQRDEWSTHWSMEDQLDLEDIIGWTSPLYTRGPFLIFLQTHFQEGLELIARLVDFATERWKHATEVRANEYDIEEKNENYTDEFLTELVEENRRFPGTLFISIDGVEREFIGDSRVYGWSCGLGSNPRKTVIVALMALEQYFYLRIDQEEAVDEDIRSVLRRVKSVAFLKVLCDVGKRLPTLFENCLQPILSVPEIYSWDIDVNVQGRSHLMIGAVIEGELFFKLAQKFNQMEHRKKDLRHLALELFFNNSAMRVFFEEVRQQWEARFYANTEDALQGFLQQLIITFDVKNYQVQEHSGYGQVILNVKAQELQASRADEQHEFEINSLILTFPIRCRNMLDEGNSLNTDELALFWEQLQQIASLDDSHYQNSPRSLSNIVNGVSGGIAVLFRFHHDWLAQYPDRKQWCLEYLRDLILEPSPAEQFDTPESPANWYWDCFVAEALPLIWVEDKENKEIRYLIAEMVFAPHYKAVDILFSRCGELRSILLEDFTRLRRLLFKLAFVRNRISFVKSFKAHIAQELIQPFIEEVNKWSREQIEAFIEARISSKIETWKLMDEPERFHAIDEVIPTWRQQYYLDFQLIKAGHAWLPTLDKVSNAEERNNILEFWNEALAYVIPRVSVGQNKKRSNGQSFNPNDLEIWVLNNVAIAILYMQQHECPENMWQPILNLPQEAHSWTEAFLQAFHKYALRQETILPNYVLITRKIVNYILPSELEENHNWSSHDEVWHELVGLGQFSIDEWEERHNLLVREMRDIFEYWVKRVPMSTHCIALFSRWLKRPVADPIRLQSLVWIEQIIEKENYAYFIEEKSVADAIACLLNTVWIRDQRRLRQNNSFFEVFRQLLRLLTNQQNEIALELVERISGFL